MNSRTKKILIAAAAALVVLVGVGAGLWTYVNAPYAGEEDAWIYLPQGTTRQAMADSLERRLGERTAARVMRVYSLAAKDSDEIRGAYRIEPGTKAKDIARRLVRHRQTPVRLTFNNVRTMAQLADRLAAQMEFTPEEFLQACGTVLPAAGFSAPQFPAAFLPDTYEFYWTETPEATVSRLLDVRNDFWTDERRARAREMGLNPVKVATLASIAEEETNDREERGTVARLYLNRLNKGMKLQADPTVKFAVGDFSLRRIRAGHLKTRSPYNTYLNPGLPPGPIRIPTARTLDAVLSAPANDYIYMCAKEDFSGTHNFARDYATHQANARRYRQALNARNIH